MTGNCLMALVTGIISITTRKSNGYDIPVRGVMSTAGLGIDLYSVHLHAMNSGRKRNKSMSSTNPTNPFLTIAQRSPGTSEAPLSNFFRVYKTCNSALDLSPCQLLSDFQTQSLQNPLIPCSDMFVVTMINLIVGKTGTQIIGPLHNANFGFRIFKQSVMNGGHVSCKLFRIPDSSIPQKTQQMVPAQMDSHRNSPFISHSRILL